MAPDDALIAEMQTRLDRKFDIVLKPLSHPAFGDIHLQDDLLAIGRGEPLFASCGSDAVAELSRRHAKIFFEQDAAYVADLGSKNGTALNGEPVREKPHRLHHGDTLCFAGTLSYRAEIVPRKRAVRHAPQSVTLTLTPERGDLGLQPLVISRFPFLVSKADETIARYKSDYPHQVNYVSRRHAHLYVQDGSVFVEDLGSTNGTFVCGKRLEDSAVALRDGELLAFGGTHFVYRIAIRREPEVDPTVTKASMLDANPAVSQADFDKTTFVAAAHSFLDIFCVDPAAAQDDEVNSEAPQGASHAKEGGAKDRPGDRLRTLIAELSDAAGVGSTPAMRRMLWGAACAIVFAAALAFTLYVRNAPERQVEGLLASGQYVAAATLANQYLERHPNDTKWTQWGTDALLKAKVPEWLAHLRAHGFGRAAAVVDDMRRLSVHSADARSLVDEIGWIGELEAFVIGRGGVDAPIRIYSDEVRIKALLSRWNDDPNIHQRAFDRIASAVPEFKDRYAAALSHLRKLQSDDSVYVAAIERLKAEIDARLNNDRVDSLPPLLDDYAAKYPRLGGLENVRADLREYASVADELREKRLGALVAMIQGTHFTTPPFQARFRALASTRLPPADIVRLYDGVLTAWRDGDTKAALTRLEHMTSGPWAEAATNELARKRAIVAQFAQLQAARASAEFSERLPRFYGGLDANEDQYFIHAIDSDIAAFRDKALARGQAMLARAQAQWTQYREHGGISGDQLADANITNSFRAQARLLSGAWTDAEQGARLYAQFKLPYPDQSKALRDQIDTEAQMQRRALQTQGSMLEPALLKEKLALIGGTGDDERQSP
jgi:pSer/pThr/pTyr-binding forkhead associated (FHA) protein